MRRLMSLCLVLCVASCENKRTAPPSPESSRPALPQAAASKGETRGGSSALPRFDSSQLRPFAPLPNAVDKPVIDAATRLGQRLYFDARLSLAGDVSCSTCHDLARAGADGAPVSVGSNKQKTKRNTPTIFNAAGAYAQGWDARASTIDEFIPPHLMDPSVMGTDEKKVVDTIRSIPAYASAFGKAFPDEKTPVSIETISQALAAFSQKLFTRSRWDLYLAGDPTALKDAELTGIAMFVEAGCITCHQGKYLGATQAQKLGIAKPWPPPAGADAGRFDVTKQEADRGVFKVPTLRNVTRTAPYLHDGSVATLPEVIRLMSRHQVGKELSDEQISAMISFLGALEGDPPKELSARPSLK